MILAPMIALALISAPPKKATEKIYSANELRDLEAILPVLKKYVAYVKVEAKDPESGPLESEERDGFGIVLDDRKIALLSFLTNDAKKITVEGPSGKQSPAKVVLYDVERRIAILHSEKSLKSLALDPAIIAPKETRKIDDEVFALTTTNIEAAVVHGVFVYVGDEEEYGGHSRIDLKLERGMPVFDRTARFVGFSRNAAWDKDRQMLITPEMIKDARTATAAATEIPREKDAKKPWWSK